MSRLNTGSVTPKGVRYQNCATRSHAPEPPAPSRNASSSDAGSAAHAANRSAATLGPDCAHSLASLMCRFRLGTPRSAKRALAYRSTKLPSPAMRPYTHCAAILVRKTRSNPMSRNQSQSASRPATIGTSTKTTTNAISSVRCNPRPDGGRRSSRTGEVMSEGVGLSESIQQFLAAHHTELLARDALLRARVVQDVRLVTPEGIHDSGERIDLAIETHALVALAQQIGRAVFATLDAEPERRGAPRDPHHQ